MSLFNDLPPPVCSSSTETESTLQLKNSKEISTSSCGMASSEARLLQPKVRQEYEKEEKHAEHPNSKPVAQTSQTTSVKRPSTEAMSNLVAKQPKLENVFLATLRSYAAERKGERDEMQDAHVLLDDCTKDFSQLVPKVTRVAYFGVFDGHGGYRASTYAAKWLHVCLAQKLPKGDVSNFDKELKRQILDAFKKVDEDFLREASQNKPVWKDGTTACCVLVLNDTLYIANLGDSKAILCRYQSDSKKHISIPLSKDHNPTNYEERMRIQKAGGTVREGRVLGILEVSRSIGDGQYKRCGVINIPEVKRCQLNSNDRFILIACDGLWKVFNPDQAIQFVLQVLQDNSLQPPEGCQKNLEEFRFETACNKLASEAVRKGSADNVTVVLVSVRKV